MRLRPQGSEERMFCLELREKGQHLRRWEHEVPPASASRAAPELRRQLASASHLKVSGRTVAKQTQQEWPGAQVWYLQALLSVTLGSRQPPGQRSSPRWGHPGSLPCGNVSSWPLTARSSSPKRRWIQMASQLSCHSNLFNSRATKITRLINSKALI